MPRIEKHKSWKARNIHLITGILYMLISLIAFLADADGWWRVILFSFFPVGLVQVGLHFWYGRKNDIISWDNEKLEIEQLGNKPEVYLWEQIDEIKITQNNLTIKSGEANGMMIDLKGFRKVDVEQLKLLIGYKSVDL